MSYASMHLCKYVCKRRNCGCVDCMYLLLLDGLNKKIGWGIGKGGYNSYGMYVLYTSEE